MIVTAANRELKGGGGVDGAVHKAAGPQLLESLKGFKRCETGNAVITDAFNLNAKYVFMPLDPSIKMAIMVKQVCCLRHIKDQYS